MSEEESTPKIVWGTFSMRSILNSIQIQPLPIRIAIWAMIIGIPLVSVVFFIFRDRLVPPPFERDVVPDEQWVCKGLEVERVERVNAYWEGLGWPEWPDPELVEQCPFEAPPGVAMWRMGAEVCQSDYSDEGGCVAHNWEENAVTIYLLPWPQIKPELRHCLAEHEGGHARGLVDVDDLDRHTNAASNVMAKECGISTRWLDRREGGDWPY